MKSALQYRYPGARPFARDQSHLFFGRDEDMRSLYQFLQLEPLVVLHGKSGLGKSSLLNASLAPEVEKGGLFVPIQFRFGSWQGEETPSPVTRVCEALQKEPAWMQPFRVNEEPNIWFSLKGHQASLGSQKGLLLIFDQFEELFSYPSDQINAFAAGLAEALYLNIPDSFRNKLESRYEKLGRKELKSIHHPLNLRVLIAIRSDRVSLLDKLKTYLPEVLTHTYELPPLSPRQAENAILSPAFLRKEDFKSPVFDYEDEAVEFLVRYLSKNKTEPIESFQLQILCQWVEQQLVIREGKQVVKKEFIHDPQEVLEHYYQYKIAEIPDPADRLAARKLIEEGLIFEEENRRLSLYEGQIRKDFGISEQLLRHLLDTHLLRSEPALRGGFTYELCHDTLVAPVLKAKKERQEEEQREREAVERRIREKELAELRRKAQVEEMLRIEAETARKNAEKAYHELAEASAKLVQLLVEDADNLILNLEYDRAFEKITAAIPLGRKKEALEERLFELAFFFAESGQTMKAEAVLACLLPGFEPGQAGPASLSERLREFSEERYDRYSRRYYPNLVRVQGGSFPMGCDPDENPDCTEAEGPVHEVMVEEFHMAMVPTTIWQYNLYCKDQGIGFHLDLPAWGMKGDYPVVKVHWIDAVNYCNWLGKRQGWPLLYQLEGKSILSPFEPGQHGYHLPTEAQWEFAARGGTDNLPYQYAGSDQLGEVGWFLANSFGRSQPVAAKRPNSLRIFDLCGNVWEWCNDWFGDYPEGSVINPAGPSGGAYKVLRGGSFKSLPSDCRITTRKENLLNSRADNVGFRVCLSL